MYGFKYETIHAKEDLAIRLKKFFNIKEEPALLEIFTPSNVNDKVLLDYFKFIL